MSKIEGGDRDDTGGGTVKISKGATWMIPERMTGKIPEGLVEILRVLTRVEGTVSQPSHDIAIADIVC